MALQEIQNGESGLAVRNALNGMFAELYNSIPTPLKYSGMIANFQVPIASNTKVTAISMGLQGGAPVIRIGLTPNGNEILDDTVVGNDTLIALNYYVPGPQQLLYFTFTAPGVIGARIDQILNYY